jgi:hypothetical protein
MSDETINPETLFSQAYRHEEKRSSRVPSSAYRQLHGWDITGARSTLGIFTLGAKVHGRMRKMLLYKQAYKNGDSTGAFNLAIDKRN